VQASRERHCWLSAPLPRPAHGPRSNPILRFSVVRISSLGQRLNIVLDSSAGTFSKPETEIKREKRTIPHRKLSYTANNHWVETDSGKIQSMGTFSVHRRITQKTMRGWLPLTSQCRIVRSRACPYSCLSAWSWITTQSMQRHSSPTMFRGWVSASIRRGNAAELVHQTACREQPPRKFLSAYEQ
jgi:hypothetical protein